MMFRLLMVKEVGAINRRLSKKRKQRLTFISSLYQSKMCKTQDLGHKTCLGSSRP